MMFLSVAVAVVCWGGVAWAAWRLSARLFRGESLAVRGVATGVIAFVFVVLALESLGLFGWINRGASSAVCLVFVFICHRIGGESVRLRDDLRGAIAWCRQRIRDGYGFAAVVVTLLVGHATLRGLRIPPLSWDSLTYHAFLPARWIQVGDLAPFAAAGGMDCGRAHPMNFELLVAWVMLPFHSDLAANFVNFPVVFLLGLAAYGLVRELGASPRFAVWAPLLVCFVRPLWSLITTQYSDILIAATILSGVLFFVRYVRSNRWQDIVVSAGAFGLSAGTKHTAILMILVTFVALTGVVVFNRGGVRRARAVLPVVLFIGCVVGGYTHVRNWVQLGNPVYPWEVKVGGTVVFEGSPIVSEWVRCNESGSRAHDWEYAKLFFSSHRLSWGTAYLLILPLALWPFLRPKQWRWTDRFLVFLWVVGLAVFFASGTGKTAMLRRWWPETTQRMFGAALALATCMAVTTLSRWRWPRSLVAILPAFVLLGDQWCGVYSQPLSFSESAIVVLGSLVVLWWVDRGVLLALVEWVSRRRGAAAIVGLCAFVLIAVGAERLQTKRNLARYTHYAESIDYDDVPRDCVEAWRMCDEVDRPHVVALAGKRHADETDSLTAAVVRWFWYPLLGSRHQNRAVYASIHEPGDVPTRQFFGGMADGGNESIWRSNLARHGVDRLLLIRGAEPETTWIRGCPASFELLGEWDKSLLYRVEIAHTTH